jgi:hypothetical protein
MLYRLGRAAVRNRCVVVLIWIVVAIVTIGAARAIGAGRWARGSHTGARRRDRRVGPRPLRSDLGRPGRSCRGRGCAGREHAGHPVSHYGCRPQRQPPRRGRDTAALRHRSRPHRCPLGHRRPGTSTHAPRGARSSHTARRVVGRYGASRRTSRAGAARPACRRRSRRSHRSSGNPLEQFKPLEYPDLVVAGGATIVKPVDLPEPGT